MIQLHDPYFQNWYKNDDIKKWYHCSIQKNTINKLLLEYCEIVQWMNENIENCIKHSRWRINENQEIDFKFRYERDYILFLLRWM